jgi:hypothetical protein
LGMALIGGTMLSVATGCVSLKAPDQVYFDGGRRVADPAEVPPTSSHAEARQKLAEAYGEIRHLRGEVADLEEDKRELKAERDACRRGWDD